MSDELVYVVDENDLIIRKEEKLLCHKEGLLHRISAVLIFNSQKELYLQKRANEKIGEGLIDYSASGHVSLNESYENSAYRELKEELGIETELKLLYDRLIEKFDYPNLFKINHIVKVYTGIYEGEFDIQKDELESIDLYSLNKIKNILEKNPESMTEALKLSLRKILK